MENNEIMEDISENEVLTINEIPIGENQDTNGIEKENYTENDKIDSHVAEDVSTENETYAETHRRRKVALIVILSILLLLDVLVLIIYLIGIDKVLGFIK